MYKDAFVVLWGLSILDYFAPWQVNVDLARFVVTKPDESDEALRKKLWLKIARHVVEQEKNIKK